MQKISQDWWQTNPISCRKGIQGLSLLFVQACKIAKVNILSCSWWIDIADCLPEHFFNFLKSLQGYYFCPDMSRLLLSVRCSYCNSATRCVQYIAVLWIRIRINLALLYPYSYWECGSRSRSNDIDHNKQINLSKMLMYPSRFVLWPIATSIFVT